MQCWNYSCFCQWFGARFLDIEFGQVCNMFEQLCDDDLLVCIWPWLPTQTLLVDN